MKISLHLILFRAVFQLVGQGRLIACAILGNQELFGAFRKENSIKIPARGEELMIIQRVGKLKIQLPCQTKNWIFVKIWISSCLTIIVATLAFAWQASVAIWFNNRRPLTMCCWSKIVLQASKSSLVVTEAHNQYPLPVVKKNVFPCTNYQKKETYLCAPFKKVL